MQESEAMATPAKYINIPKTFSSGDLDKWFCSFEICRTANEWSAATQAV